MHAAARTRRELTPLCLLCSPSDFEWVKQLRYYWREEELYVDMVQVRPSGLVSAAWYETQDYLICAVVALGSAPILFSGSEGHSIEWVH